MSVNRSKLYLLALLPFSLVVVLFELVPLLMVIFRSLMPEGSWGFTLSHFATIFTKRLYQQAVVNSILVALFSAVIGLVIAFFGAKAAQGAQSHLRGIFMSILNMTSNFAGIPLAFSYIIMFGNVGVFVMLGKRLNWDWLASFDLYTVGGLALVYVYFQIPLAILLLIPAFAAIRPEWREAVSLLGGRSMTFWLQVGIPVLMPSLLGTLSVLFANAIAAYATAYALLQNNFSILPIRISEQFVGDIIQRREFGSALAVVLMLLMLMSVLLNNKILHWTRGRSLENE